MIAIATIVLMCCFVTSLLDMGMNGAARADWAPWGLGISMICALYIVFA